MVGKKEKGVHKKEEGEGKQGEWQDEIVDFFDRMCLLVFIGMELKHPGQDPFIIPCILLSGLTCGDLVTSRL
jgi:hypothetical protein